ncbi:DUF4837 family protein [candidate division KSB1 bacterium]|nr:DUF4837 family protein [candidate division KSB1 bacterium]
MEPACYSWPDRNYRGRKGRRVLKGFLPIGLILSLIVILFSSCGSKPAGKGQDHEIVVLADSALWAVVEDPLRGIFEWEIMTPQHEKIFSLRPIPYSDFTQYNQYKNLLLVSTLSNTGEAGMFINSLFTPEVRKGIRYGDYYVFIKQNQWARDQLVMILAAEDSTALKEKIVEHRDFLYGRFDGFTNARLRRDLYRSHEQVHLSRELFQKYGFRVRIQHDYFVVKEDSGKHLVRLRRLYPDRWLAFWWEGGASPSSLTEEFCLEKRRWLGGEFNDPVDINDEFLKIEPTEFLGREAIRISGLWHLKDGVGGGPFRTYGFYDENSGRVYMIDLAVFAPAWRKEPLLRQLEIMARTFKTE